METIAKLGTDRHLPGTPEPKMPRIFYAESKDSADAVYVPVSALNLIPGVKAEPAEDLSF